MSREPLRRYTRRDQTSARDQNAVRQAVEDRARDRPASGGGLHSAGRAGAQVLVNDQPVPLWVSIDDVGVTSQRYEAWTEQQDDGAGGWVPPGDALTGSAVLPAFLPPGWPAPAVGDVVLALPSADGSSLLLLTPAAATGSSGHPVVNNYGPYVTWHFVGPSVYLDFTGAQVTYGVEHVTWGADQVDFLPLESTMFLVVNLTANVTLRSLAGTANGRALWIFNVSNAFTLTLANEDAAGASSMRLRLPGAVDLSLGRNNGWGLSYDGDLPGGAAPYWNSLDDRRPVEDRDQINALRAYLPRPVCACLPDPDASLTVRGYVSLVPQSLGAGAKYFSDKVGIGTTGPLSNSALDVRGYGGVYFAGSVYFGGGNFPAAEADGCLLGWDGGTKILSLDAPAAVPAAGQAVGVTVDVVNNRLVLNYKTGGSVGSFQVHNVDTGAYTTIGGGAAGDADMILSGIVYGP